MHERLKHLIVSSETFWSKMRTGYGARIETKPDEIDKLVGSKGQEEFQAMSTYYSLSKDRPNNNGTIGITDE